MSAIPVRHEKQIWTCKIGECDLAKLPDGADAPMREAVRQAYFDLVGEYPEFLFSGWNGQLDRIERQVVQETH